jgi:hypothetical protein
MGGRVPGFPLLSLPDGAPKGTVVGKNRYLSRNISELMVLSRFRNKVIFKPLTQIN